MIDQRWKGGALLCAVLSPVLVAGCSQTASSGISAASLSESVRPYSVSSSSIATPARPYRYTARDRECLERAMFFESNRSSRDGMIAVGTVVMNRLRSGKHGTTICDVVGEPRQFAPGVMTRKMNSRAMPDVQEAAQAVLKGERSPKLRSAMFFHTAGLKFPYDNMHYVLVAGGNAFYEKRGRNFQPLPDDKMVVVAADDAAAAPPVMMASAAPEGLPGVKPPAELPDAAPVTVASIPAARPVAVAFAQPARQLPGDVPFATASADAGLDDGFDSAAPQPVQARPGRKKQGAAAAPAPAAAFAVASAAPVPGKRPKIAVIGPDSAPLPVARASMIPLPAKAAKPRKALKPQVVDVAADEPLAARFGGGDDPVLSFGQ